MSMTSTMTSIMGEKVKPLRVKRDVDMNVKALQLSKITITGIEGVEVFCKLHWYRPKISTDSKGKTTKGQSDVGTSEEFVFDFSAPAQSLSVDFKIGGGLTFNDNYTKPKEKLLHIDVIFAKQSESGEKHVKIGTVSKSIDLGEIYCGEMRSLLKKIRKNIVKLDTCTQALVETNIDLEGEYGGSLLLEFKWDIDPLKHFPTLDPVQYQQKLLAAQGGAIENSTVTTDGSGGTSIPDFNSTSSGPFVAVGDTKKNKVTKSENSTSQPVLPTMQEKQPNPVEPPAPIQDITEAAGKISFDSINAEQQQQQKEKEEAEAERLRLEKKEMERQKQKKLEEEERIAKKKQQEEEELAAKKKREMELAEEKRKQQQEAEELKRKQEEKERIEQEQRRKKEKEEEEKRRKQLEQEQIKKEEKEREAAIEKERREKEAKEEAARLKRQEEEAEKEKLQQQQQTPIAANSEKSKRPPPPPPPKVAPKNNDDIIKELESLDMEMQKIANQVSPIKNSNEKKEEDIDEKIVVETEEETVKPFENAVEADSPKAAKSNSIDEKAIPLPIANIDMVRLKQFIKYITKLKNVFSINVKPYSSLIENCENCDSSVVSENSIMGNQSVHESSIDESRSKFQYTSSYKNSFILNMPFKSPVSKSITTVANELGLSLQRRMMFPIRIHILKTQQSKAQSAGSVTAPILLSVLKKKIPIDYKYIIRSILTTCSCYSRVSQVDTNLPSPNALMNLSIPQSILPDYTKMTNANIPSAFMYILQAMSVWGAFCFKSPKSVLSHDSCYNNESMQQTYAKNTRHLYNRLLHQFNGNIESFCDYISTSLNTIGDQNANMAKKESKKDIGPTNVDELPENLKALGAAQCIITGINNVTDVSPRLPVSIEMVLGRVVVQSIHTNDWIKPNPADVISFLIEELRVNIKCLLYEGCRNWLSPNEETATKGISYSASACNSGNVSVKENIEIEIQNEEKKEKDAENSQNMQNIKSNDRILMTLKAPNPIVPRIPTPCASIEAYLSARNEIIVNTIKKQHSSSAGVSFTDSQMSRNIYNDQMAVFTTPYLGDTISRCLIALSYGYAALLFAKCIGLYAAGNSSINFDQIKDSYIDNSLYDNVVLCDDKEFYSSTEKLSNPLIVNSSSLIDDNLEKILFRGKSESYGVKSYSHAYASLMAIYVKTICRVSFILSNAIWLEALRTATQIDSSTVFKSNDYLELCNHCCGRDLESRTINEQQTQRSVSVYMVKDVIFADPTSFCTNLANIMRKAFAHLTKTYTFDGSIDAALTTLILRQISAKFINAIVQSSSAYISNEEVMRRQKGRLAIKPVLLDSQDYIVYGNKKPFYIPFIQVHTLKLAEIIDSATLIVTKPLAEAKKCSQTFKNLIHELNDCLREKENGNNNDLNTEAPDLCISSIKKTAFLINCLVSVQKRIINDSLININSVPAANFIPISLAELNDQSTDKVVDELETPIPSIDMLTIMLRVLNNYSSKRITNDIQADKFVSDNQYVLLNPIVIDNFLGSLNKIITHRTTTLANALNLFTNYTTICMKLLGKEQCNSSLSTLNEQHNLLQQQSVSQYLIRSSNLFVAKQSKLLMSLRMSEWVNDACYFVRTENLLFSRLFFFSRFKANQNLPGDDDNTFIVRYVNSVDIWMAINLMPWGLPTNDELYEKLRVIPECTFVKPPLSWV